MDDRGDLKRAAATPSPTKTKPRYRDDPEAVSLHTTRSDYEYDDDLPQFPSYDDAATVEVPTANNHRMPTLSDTYRTIAQPTIPRPNRQHSGPQTVSIGQETSIRMEESLMDPENLQEYITNYLQTVPPDLYIRVQGWHWQHSAHANNKKKEKERAYDFDVVFRLNQFLSLSTDSALCQKQIIQNSDQAYRGSFRRTRAPGYTQDLEVGSASTPTLLEWCEDFCHSKTPLKIFRISRHFDNFNHALIQQRLTTLIHATHYRGHIDISFPTANKNIDIYSPHWINTARITWIRWLFYLTFLWLLTWPLLFFCTRKWSVYHIRWHWRSHQSAAAAAASSPTRYASISEDEWVDRHANLLQSLILDKFHGDATEMPRDVHVDVHRRRSEQLRMPSMNLRGGALNAAMGLLQGGVSVWNQASGNASQGWGGDEC